MTANGADAAAAERPAGHRRPGVLLGVLAGAGLQVVDVVLMLTLATIASRIEVGTGGTLVILAPFLVVLAGSALLMASWYWRWFALGVLLVTAATLVLVVAVGPMLGVVSRA